jgi:hypothetical protein
MAKTATISKMYPKEPGGAAERTDLAAIAAKSQSSAIAENLPAGRELPVRGRFVLGRERPEAVYSLDSAEIMSVMQPGGPVDRSSDLQILAVREKAAQLARRWLRARQRGSAGSAGGAISIQT